MREFRNEKSGFSHVYPQIEKKKEWNL